MNGARWAAAGAARLACLSLALPFVLAWSLPSIAHAQAPSIDRATLIRLSSSVLRVEAVRAHGGFSLGSAVAVAPDQVVTNCHVTREATEVRVLRGGRRWTAQGQRADTARDLCLLRVPGLNAVPVRLGPTSELAVGQPVDALGYTGGLGLQASSGELVALHRHAGSRVVQSSNAFNSGASGGGLFDDRQRLVGVLTFRLRGGSAHYFSAPAQWLQALIDEPAEWQSVAPLTDQPLPYWELPVAQQPLFLQAALLERTGRWSQLSALADDWLHRDPQDAEPWYLLAIAAIALDQRAQARQALRCALVIEPAMKPARDRLATLLPEPDEASRPPEPDSCVRP